MREKEGERKGLRRRGKPEIEVEEKERGERGTELGRNWGGSEGKYCYLCFGD